MGGARRRKQSTLPGVLEEVTRKSRSLPGVLSRASGRGVSQEGDTEHSGNCEEDGVRRKECSRVAGCREPFRPNQRLMV